MEGDEGGDLVHVFASTFGRLSVHARENGG
jgi:hypothetical protein